MLVSSLQALTGHREQSDHTFCPGVWGAFHPPTAVPDFSDLLPHTGGKEVPTSGLTFPSAPGSSRLVDLKPKQAPGLPYRPGQNTDDGASPKSFGSAGVCGARESAFLTRG